MLLRRARLRAEPLRGAVVRTAGAAASRSRNWRAGVVVLPRSARARAARPSAARRGRGRRAGSQQRLAQRRGVAVGDEHAGRRRRRACRGSRRRCVETTGVPQAIASSTAHGVRVAVGRQAHHVGLLLEVEQARVGRAEPVDAHARRARARRRGSRGPAPPSRRARPPSAASRSSPPFSREAPADEQHARPLALAPRRGPVALEVDPGMVLDRPARRAPGRSTARRAQSVHASTSAARRSARRSSARLGAIVARRIALRAGARPASPTSPARSCPSTARPASRRIMAAIARATAGV